MDMALGVLQTMAEKGNKYIRACHSLLTKIKGTIKPKHSTAVANVGAQEPMADQPQNESISQAEAIIPGLPNDQNGFGLDFAGDPALWAEVLDSIDIDMDRQWVETALRRGQQLETAAEDG